MYLGVAGGRGKAIQTPFMEIKYLFLRCKFRESIFGHQHTVEWYCYLLKLFCSMSLMKAVLRAK